MKKIYQKTFPSLKKPGFTLIELLVVVLIIGILAAVAVPQYEMAVAKSRVAQVLPFMASVKKAQEAYYAANGEYSSKWENLDVTIPQGLTVSSCDSGGTETECATFSFGAKCSLLSNGGAMYCFQGSSSLPLIGLAYEKGAFQTWVGPRICIAGVNNSKQDKICRTLGGVLKQTSGLSNYYSF